MEEGPQEIGKALDERRLRRLIAVGRTLGSQRTTAWSSASTIRIAPSSAFAAAWSVTPTRLGVGRAARNGSDCGFDLRITT